MKDRDLVILALLVWWLWPKPQPPAEETSVSFPESDVYKTCPGGWEVPWNLPCPPTT